MAAERRPNMWFRGFGESLQRRIDTHYDTASSLLRDATLFEF